MCGCCRALLSDHRPLLPLGTLGGKPSRWSLARADPRSSGRCTPMSDTQGPESWGPEQAAAWLAGLSLASAPSASQLTGTGAHVSLGPRQGRPPALASGCGRRRRRCRLRESPSQLAHQQLRLTLPVALHTELLGASEEQLQAKLGVTADEARPAAGHQTSGAGGRRRQRGFALPLLAAVLLWINCCWYQSASVRLRRLAASAPS